MIFELDRDREVSLPLAASARLARATSTERDHWSIGYGGISVHWPDVDEDIAIWEILGIGEGEYLRWLHETPVG